MMLALLRGGLADNVWRRHVGYFAILGFDDWNRMRPKATYSKSSTMIVMRENLLQYSLLTFSYILISSKFCLSTFHRRHVLKSRCPTRFFLTSSPVLVRRYRALRHLVLGGYKYPRTLRPIRLSVVIPSSCPLKLVVLLSRNPTGNLYHSHEVASFTLGTRSIQVLRTYESLYLYDNYSTSACITTAPRQDVTRS